MDHSGWQNIEGETTELKEIIRTETEIDYYVCSECSTTFTTPNDLAYHFELCRFNIEITATTPANICNSINSSANYNKITSNDNNEVVTPLKVNKSEVDLSNEIKLIANADEINIDDGLSTGSNIHSDGEQLTENTILSETLKTLAGYDIRKAEMLKNLLQIETDAGIMETNDICFCCDESYDTFHLGQIQCTHCRKSFKSQMSFERHVFITHSECDDYLCTICNAKMRSERLLELHMDQHQNRGMPFACKDCGKDFKREYDWRRHRKYSVCGQSDKDAFSCKNCDKKFNYLPSLRDHMKKNCGTTVSNKPRHMCMICEKTFSSSCDLEVHATVHSEERPFECDVCSKKFKRLRLLRNHRILHTDERPFVCEVCSLTFKTKRLKDRHMRRHTSEPLHPCDECGRKFFQMSELRTHLKQHIKPYECDVCDEKFKTENLLGRHLKRVHRRRKTTINKKKSQNKQKRKSERVDTNEIEEITIPPIACKLEEDALNENEFITNDNIGVTSKVFKLENDSSSENEFTNTVPAQISPKTQEVHRKPLPGYDLRAAEMLKNLDQIETDAIVMESKNICFCCDENYDTCHFGHIKCSDCRKSFKSEISFERHIFIVHSEFNDYPCTICNAMLRSANLLKLHLEQHQNRGKPFSCKVCGNEFSREYDWKYHQKYTVCGQGDTDAFKCKLCNKKFKYKHNLRKHTQKHLGERSPNKSKHICPICKKTFSYLSDLKAHATVHSEDRPFECDLCDKKFKRLRFLRNHRMHHTDERPFPCEVCNRSFKVKYERDRHMKRHTDEQSVYDCNECGKRFFKPIELKKHYKRAHINAFECAVCNKKFKSEKTLEHHVKNVHGIEKVDTHREEVAMSPLMCKLEEELPIENEFITNDEVCVSSKVYKPHDESSNEMKFSIDIVEDDGGAHIQEFNFYEVPCTSSEILSDGVQLIANSILAQTSPKTQEVPINPLAINQMCKAEMLKNLDKIEEEAIMMENHGVCFCCEENYDTCHFGIIKCSVCRKSFKSKITYERHTFLIHSELNDFPCTICNAKMRSENLLKLHLEQHQNRGLLYACKVCGKDFARESNWKFHQKYSVCGQNDTDPFKCKICKRKFIYSYNLRTHMKKHFGTHASKRGRHICLICRKTFSRLYDLKEHATTHTGKRPFNSKLCDNKFKRSTCLRIHDKLHSDERPHTCQWCSRSFRLKYQRDRHMKRHTDKPIHVCDECGKGFIILYELQTHQKRVHRKRYECDVCNEKFKTEKTLELHTKCVHNNEQIETNKDNEKSATSSKISELEEELPNESITNDEISISPKGYHQLEAGLSNEISIINDNDNGAHTQEREVYVCPVCKKSYGKPSHLKIHSIVHSEERPFKCELCHMKFKRIACLRKHRIVHTNQRPHKCGLCNISFKRKYQRDRHLRRHTDEPVNFCDECGKGFVIKYELKSHKLRTHGKLYECGVCNEKFKTGKRLELHTLCVHNSEVFDTNDDKEVTKSPSRIEPDASNDEVAIPPKVHKPLKENLSNAMDTVDNDVNGVQEQKKQINMCPICNRTFSNLKIHALVHTEERPFKCNSCDKKFKRIGCLRKHRLVHTNHRPYKCELCSRLFKLKYQRDLHMKRHTGKPVHICDECGKGFIILYELNAHYTRAHGKPFVCDVCNKKFTTNKTLESHKYMHSTTNTLCRDIVEFKCTECVAAFSTKEDLSRHIENECDILRSKKIQSTAECSTKRNDCVLCDKNFKNSTSLQSHLLIDHDTDPEDYID